MSQATLHDDADEGAPGPLARLGARVLELIWPGHPRRWRDVPRRLRSNVTLVVRLTVAAVIAFLLSARITGMTTDITGPLTAILVVQATAFSTLRMALVRVGAVVTGVLVAILLSSWFGLSWWSLGIAVATALVIAQLLRLGDQMLEAPISAMLILAVHGDGLQAETRVINTLIGMAVGMVLSLVVAPVVPSRQAATEIRRLGESIAGSLRSTASSMREYPITLGQVGRWLDDVRSLGGQVSTAARRVQEIHETRRLNPRAIRAGDAEPELRRNLDTLERVLAAVRALYTVLQREAPAGQAQEDTFGAEVRPAFAVVLDTMADCILAYGSLVEDRYHHRSQTPATLAEALDTLRESRAILTELMLVNAHEQTSLWLLRGSVLAAVEQALAELDIIERERRIADAYTPLNQEPPM